MCARSLVTAFQFSPGWQLLSVNRADKYCPFCRSRSVGRRTNIDRTLLSSFDVSSPLSFTHRLATTFLFSQKKTQYWISSLWYIGLDQGKRGAWRQTYYSFGFLMTSVWRITALCTFFSIFWALLVTLGFVGGWYHKSSVPYILWLISDPSRPRNCNFRMPQ